MKVTEESHGGTILKVWAAFVSLFWYFLCLLGCLLLFLLVPTALGLTESKLQLHGLNDSLRHYSGVVGAMLFFILGALANDWLWHDDEARGRLDHWAGKFSALPHQMAAILVLFVCAPFYLAELGRVLLKIPHGLVANQGPLTRIMPRALSSKSSWVALACGSLWLTTNLYAYVHYPLVSFEPRPPAKVSVDGTQLGVTPLTQPLTVGNHHLKLEFKNQPPVEEDLQVPMGGLTYNKRVRGAAGAHQGVH